MGIKSEIRHRRIAAQQYAMVLMVNSDITMEDAIAMGIKEAPSFVDEFNRQWEEKGSKTVCVVSHDKLSSKEVEEEFYGAAIVFGTATIKDQPFDVNEPTPAEIFVWNWQTYGGDNFSSLLAHLIAKADTNNRAKIAMAYPLEVSAMRNFLNTNGWWDAVDEKIRAWMSAQNATQGDPTETQPTPPAQTASQAEGNSRSER